MEVTWVRTEDELPPVDGYGHSKQVVIRVKTGYLGTGFYSKSRDEWLLDGLISSKDMVTHWLKGLENGIRES